MIGGFAFGPFLGSEGVVAPVGDWVDYLHRWVPSFILLIAAREVVPQIYSGGPCSKGDLQTPLPPVLAKISCFISFRCNGDAVPQAFQLMSGWGIFGVVSSLRYLGS